jgi:hypothetical protein
LPPEVNVLATGEQPKKWTVTSRRTRGCSPSSSSILLSASCRALSRQVLTRRCLRTSPAVQNLRLSPKSAKTSLTATAATAATDEKILHRAYILQLSGVGRGSGAAGAGAGTDTAVGRVGAGELALALPQRGRSGPMLTDYRRVRARRRGAQHARFTLISIHAVLSALERSYRHWKMEQ